MQLACRIALLVLCLGMDCCVSAAEELPPRLRRPVDAIWLELEKHYVVMPLFLLDHSGISISTGSPSR